jgi:hypothetical protein
MQDHHCRPAGQQVPMDSISFENQGNLDGYNAAWLFLG